MLLLEAAQLPAVPEEQFAPLVEVFLEDDADALRGEVGAGVVAVVGLVVGLQADGARTVHQASKSPTKLVFDSGLSR